jgi:Domain of unknown function (DUF4123)
MTSALSENQSISALLRALTAKGDLIRVFALIDGAILRELPKTQRKHWPTHQATSLLVRASADAAEVGPLLFGLTPTQLHTQLADTLLDTKTGRIAGSFITTRANTPELVEQLTRFVDVTLDDGSEMVMRYFDARVFPFWLEVLTPPYRAHAASVVNQWLYWGSDLQVKTISFTQAPQHKEPDWPMQISVQQENALMTACEPFTMIERFRTQDGAALSKVAPEQRYAFFREQLERAQRHGLSGQSDLEAYCSIALDCGPKFDEHPAIKAALAHMKTGQTFSKALSAVNDADWKLLRGA